MGLIRLIRYEIRLERIKLDKNNPFRMDGSGWKGWNWIGITHSEWIGVDGIGITLPWKWMVVDGMDEIG